jgi:hypothetical protein
MRQLNLFLTFDYELPLGGWTVSPEDALIEPAQKILTLCDRLQVHVVFFVDVLCLIRFQRLGANTFEKAVKKQLTEIVEKGHDIQLHLHPHWFTSNIENGDYTPSKDFRLADFSELEIEDMVVQSIACLNEIAKPVKPDYSCLAFRAGGFNLENSQVIFRILSKHGIRFDSSLCRGYYFASDISTVDYRNLPDQANWYFENGKYNEPTVSGIYEIPVVTKPKSIVEIPTWIKAKLYQNRMPENRGKMIHSETQIPFQQKLRKAFSARMLSFDNYTYSTKYLLKILDDHIKRYEQQPIINLAAISHPKSMDWYNFQLMEDFIVSARKRYGNHIAFTTFQDFFHSQTL